MLPAFLSAHCSKLRAGLNFYAISMQTHSKLDKNGFSFQIQNYLLRAELWVCYFKRPSLAWTSTTRTRINHSRSRNSYSNTAYLYPIAIGRPLALLSSLGCSDFCPRAVRVCTIYVEGLYCRAPEGVRARRRPPASSAGLDRADRRADIA